MDFENRHLKRNGPYWHYQRRAPRRFASIDDRCVIECSLRTQSLEIARLRRDALENSDNMFWASIAGIDEELGSPSAMQRQYDVAKRCYDSAIARALSRGFVYEPVKKLAETTGIGELMDRIDAIKDIDTSKLNPILEAESSALLGCETLPAVNVLTAFDTYCSEIAADDLVGKSETQIAAWKKAKKLGDGTCLSASAR